MKQKTENSTSISFSWQSFINIVKNFWLYWLNLLLMATYALLANFLPQLVITPMIGAVAITLIFYTISLALYKFSQYYSQYYRKTSKVMFRGTVVGTLIFTILTIIEATTAITFGAGILGFLEALTAIAVLFATSAGSSIGLTLFYVGLSIVPVVLFSIYATNLYLDYSRHKGYMPIGQADKTELQTLRENDLAQRRKIFKYLKNEKLRKQEEKDHRYQNEWEFAEAFFKKFPDATKLSRADFKRQNPNSEVPLKCSFVIFNGDIYRLPEKHKKVKEDDKDPGVAGKGSSTRFKYAYTKQDDIDKVLLPKHVIGRMYGETWSMEEADAPTKHSRPVSNSEGIITYNLDGQFLHEQNNYQRLGKFFSFSSRQSESEKKKQGELVIQNKNYKLIPRVNGTDLFTLLGLAPNQTMQLNTNFAGILNLCIKIAKGFQNLHNKGTLHNDIFISPNAANTGNIMVDTQIKLIDDDHDDPPHTNFREAKVTLVDFGESIDMESATPKQVEDEYRGIGITFEKTLKFLDKKQSKNTNTEDDLQKFKAIIKKLKNATANNYSLNTAINELEALRPKKEEVPVPAGEQTSERSTASLTR
jgi:hypothetical protein